MARGKVFKAIASAARMAPSQMMECAAYVVTASAPTVTPNGGEYVGLVRVTLESATNESMIHFTLDGTDPDETSQQYDAPLVIRQTNTAVKAIAVHPLLANSKVTTSAEFVITASPPELSPKSCVFTGNAKISISTATASAQLHCTLDGTTPTVDSPVCTSPLSITKTGSILKAIVTKPGLSPSDVVSLGDKPGTAAIALRMLPVFVMDRGDVHKGESTVGVVPSRVQ